MALLASWDVSSAVKSIDLSQDGTHLVSGSDDGYVRVWDVQIGALVLGPLKGHTRRVGSVAFSYDNSLIVSGSDDATIRIWNAHTGDPIGEPLKGHTGAVCSVMFSPDNSRIVSGSYDDNIRIWDTRERVPVGDPLKGHNNVVSSVAFSPDSAYIVSGSWDCTIRVWDAHTRVPLGKPLEGHDRSVYSVAFSPDSTRIVSGSWDCTIRVWDAYTGNSVGKPLKGHTGSVCSVAFSHDNTHIISSSFDNTIRIWDAATGAPVGELFKGHTNVVYSTKFLPNSTRIISCSLDCTICVWETKQLARSGEEKTPSRYEEEGYKGEGEGKREGETTGDTKILGQGLLFQRSGSGGKQSPAAGTADTTRNWRADTGNSGSGDLVQRAPKFNVVTSQTTAQEMLNHLVAHGCTDLSSSIELDNSSSPALMGGNGDVYRARMKDGLIVAIKCLRQDMVSRDGLKGTKRLAREIYVWSKLRHENIQELLGVVIFRGQLSMVSVWREKGDISMYIENYPDVDRYLLCLQLANGISYLHGVGVVHGDIKGRNTLMSDDGVAKLIDFELSILPSNSLRFSSTTRGTAGTLRWMAPELIMREEDDDDDDDDDGNAPEARHNTKTDIYSLGMTMLEIVTGRVPYSEYQHDMAIFRRLGDKKPPSRPKELSGLNERETQMWKLLLKCWDRDQEARPDALSVLKSLQSLVS